MGNYLEKFDNIYALGRPPKTVMREITNRAIRSLKGSVGRINNRCVHRFDCEGNRIANLFYCDPGASYQKAHAERNHEGIRLILPKGNCYLLPTSFDDLTQIDSFRRTIESPCHGTPLSQRPTRRPFTPLLTFTLSVSVEVNAKSVKVNAHTGQNDPKLWAFTLSVNRSFADTIEILYEQDPGISTIRQQRQINRAQSGDGSSVNGE